MFCSQMQPKHLPCRGVCWVLRKYCSEDYMRNIFKDIAQSLVHSRHSTNNHGYDLLPEKTKSSRAQGACSEHSRPADRRALRTVNSVCSGKQATSRVSRTHPAGFLWLSSAMFAEGHDLHAHQTQRTASKLTWSYRDISSHGH